MTANKPCGCADKWIFCEVGKKLWCKADLLLKIWRQTNDPKDREKYEVAKEKYDAHREGLTT